MAKKTQLNVSIGVDSKGYEKSWDEIIKITQESGNDLEKEAAKMALAVSKKIEKMSPKSQARQLETLTVKMVEMGMEGTKAFNMVTKSAGTLKATIDDAKGLIDAMRPDAPFNALNTTLGASAQAFAGVQGAMALFGAESEDLQKTLIKVQGAMALAEGFKAIDGLTDGFKQLNLVVKQNPLIAGAAVIATATTAFIALSDSTENLTEKTKALFEIQNRAFESSISERVEMERLIRVYNDKNTTDAERLKIQKTLIEKFPEYFGQLSSEHVEINKTNAAVVAYIKLLEMKARAQAAQELYVEALKKEQKAQMEVNKQIESGTLGSPLNLMKKQLGFGEDVFSLDAAKKASAEFRTIYDTLQTQADDLSESIQKSFGDDLVEPIKKTTDALKQFNAAMPKAPKSKVDMSPLNAGADQGNPFDRKAGTPQTNYSPIEGGMYEPSTPSQPLGTTIDAAQLIDPEKLAESKKAMLEMDALSQQISSSMVSAFSAIGDEMASSLDTGNKALDRFAGAMIKTVTEIIGMLVAQAVAQSITNATQTAAATGPAAVFTAPAFIATAVGGVMAAFAAIPKFETGGVVGGSSYHGDKILARVNSGELILNTGQQKAVLNAMGNSNMVMAETKISGRDLAIVLKKYNQDISRG